MDDLTRLNLLIGRNLQLRRETLGLTRRALALLVEEPEPDIAAIEDGRLRLHPVLLMRFSEILTVPPTYFFRPYQ